MVRARQLRTTLSNIREDLWSEGRGGILLFVSLGWFSTLGIRIVFPALLPQIAASFSINYAAAGGLIGVLWASYALMQYPGGVLADALGERTVMLVSLLATFIAIGGLVMTPTYGLFIIATIVLGIGTGLYGTSRVTVISDTFSDWATTAISITQATGNLGNVILPVIAGLVSVALGWRMGFAYLVPMFVVAAVGIRIFLPKRTSTASDIEIAQSIRKVVATVIQREVLLATGILFLIMFEYQSITGFLPLYIVEVKGLDQDIASVLYGVFFAAAMAIQFVSGMISDRYGQRLAIGMFLGASVPAFFLLSLADSLLSLAGTIILLSSVLGGFPPAHAHAVKTLPDDIQGSSYGLIRTLYIGLGATGPLFVGFMADSNFFDEAFLLLGGIAAFATGIILVLPVLE